MNTSANQYALQLFYSVFFGFGCGVFFVFLRAPVLLISDKKRVLKEAMSAAADIIGFLFMSLCLSVFSFFTADGILRLTSFCFVCAVFALTVKYAQKPAVALLHFVIHVLSYPVMLSVKILKLIFSPILHRMGLLVLRICDIMRSRRYHRKRIKSIRKNLSDLRI